MYGEDPAVAAAIAVCIINCYHNTVVLTAVIGTFRCSYLYWLLTAFVPLCRHCDNIGQSDGNIQQQ